MTLAERFPIAEPGWKQDVAQPVIIRNRSGSVSSRRPYPVSKNPRFIPPRSHENFTDIIGVGEGNDIYLEPDADAESESEESKDRIKRIKNVGDGAEVLVAQDLEAIPPEATNKLRSIKAAAGALLSVTQKEEVNEVDSTGVDGSIAINITGQIGATRGIIHTLLEGRRGTTGELTRNPCSGSPEVILTWEEGQITSQSKVFDVGECGDSSGTPGIWGTYLWSSFATGVGSHTMSQTFENGKLVSSSGTFHTGSGTQADPVVAYVQND